MNIDRQFNIIIAPYQSEKAHRIADKNRQIAFKVVKDATKTEVKKAVEKLFDVKVDSVNILNQKGKSKTFALRKGRTKDWKKAYVCLKEGQDISFEQS